MALTTLLTTADAATKLAMLHSRVIRLARKGVIPSVCLPDGEIRFDPEDLALWISRYKRPQKNGGDADGA